MNAMRAPILSPPSKIGFAAARANWISSVSNTVSNSSLVVMAMAQASSFPGRPSEVWTRCRMSAIASLPFTSKRHAFSAALTTGTG
ncbi:hypothetical protein PFLmoz3_05026 [Pseudomonas fluorescens]|uniref:Uncharacterized protein n=1 Tax=Pseudomonas fluorescens TaxID=294 RepID=A0A120G687_PSEFL|nr:hypothetical protein PFLmoz3_05026 [Pseudomonas fluorescens]